MLFRDLKAYQHALRVAALSRPLIKRLPASEHDLADQWRRAAYSVPLNIAEGTGRKGPREFCRYLSFALGSLREVEAILELVEGLEYLSVEEIAQLKEKRANCARMVFGLVRRFS